MYRRVWKMTGMRKEEMETSVVFLFVEFPDWGIGIPISYLEQFSQ